MMTDRQQAGKQPPRQHPGGEGAAVTAEDYRLAVYRQTLAESKRSNYNDRPPAEWHGCVEAALAGLLAYVDEREEAARAFLGAVHDALDTSTIDSDAWHLRAAAVRVVITSVLESQNLAAARAGAGVLRREIGLKGGRGRTCDE